uniref:PKD-like family lipoprotein n=1 Tax=Pedobacter schmidteae TaxID=2201271 RepID=UPI000EAD21C6|nr:PKD-like family lipoprotein [Pedobacter schmidteae]
MKLYIYIICLFCTATLMIAGCAKDEGNYDYKKLNKVNIDSIPDFTLMKFDSLKIAPVITKSDENSKLTYEWKIYSPITGLTKQLSTEKRLAIVVEEEPSVNAYEVILKVTDPATGISDFRTFDLKIVTPFSQGWVVLNKRGANTDIDMITPGDKVYDEIYKRTNGNAIPGGANRVYTYFGQQEQKVFLQSNTDILQLKGNDFAKIIDYNSLFFEKPAVLAPQLYFMKNRDSREYIINNGDLYFMATAVPPPTRFGDKVSGDYRAAPFMAVGSRYPGIIYDEKNGRFLQLPANKSELTAFPYDAKVDPFDMNNIGKKMVFMRAAPVTDHYYAICKNLANNSFHFYVINSNGTPAVKYQQMLNVPDIDRASSFAVSATLPLIYYAVDQKIYVYDLEMNAARKVYDAPGAGANVAVLGMLNTVLVAGVNEGENGTVYYLNLAPTGDVTSTAKKFPGIGKIIDMVYKPQ